jgi:hypothetical protein
MQSVSDEENNDIDKRIVRNGNDSGSRDEIEGKAD